MTRGRFAVSVLKLQSKTQRTSKHEPEFKSISYAKKPTNRIFELDAAASRGNVAMRLSVRSKKNKALLEGNTKRHDRVEGNKGSLKMSPFCVVDRRTEGVKSNDTNLNFYLNRLNSSHYGL